MSKMSMRTIVVDGRTWKWGVGKQNIIVRAQDNNESRHIDFSTLTGLSWTEIERGQWKRWFKITPKHIAAWLNNSLQKL